MKSSIIGIAVLCAACGFPTGAIFSDATPVRSGAGDGPRVVNGDHAGGEGGGEASAAGAPGKGGFGVGGTLPYPPGGSAQGGAVPGGSGGVLAGGSGGVSGAGAQGGGGSSVGGMSAGTGGAPEGGTSGAAQGGEASGAPTYPPELLKKPFFCTPYPPPWEGGPNWSCGDAQTLACTNYVDEFDDVCRVAGTSLVPKATWICCDGR